MSNVEHEEKRTPCYHISQADCHSGSPFGRTERSGTLSNCTCGAQWSHPKNRMDSIFASHVKYFERTTVVL